MSVRFLGILLFLLQLAACLALLALGWPGMSGHPALWIGVAAGGFTLAWAVAAMRLPNVRVTPEPGADAELCRRGPYGLIRHPMYSGQLLAFAMFALAEGGGAGAVTWLLLLAVLVTKMRLEEGHWRARDPAYADYMRTTKRLVPWVF